MLVVQLECVHCQRHAIGTPIGWIPPPNASDVNSGLATETGVVSLKALAHAMAFNHAK